MCFNFKNLRVLSFCQFDEVINLGSIGKLVHLRYLDLSHNRLLQKLPKPICKLHQLQSLSLKCCTSLEKLPSSVRYMVSLYINLATKQTQLEGIELLTSLCTLKISHCCNLVTLPEELQNLTYFET